MEASLGRFAHGRSQQAVHPAQVRCPVGDRRAEGVVRDVPRGGVQGITTGSGFAVGGGLLPPGGVQTTTSPSSRVVKDPKGIKKKNPTLLDREIKIFAKNVCENAIVGPLSSPQTIFQCVGQENIATGGGGGGPTTPLWVRPPSLLT